MQSVANEMQLSETAFLVPRKEDKANSFDLRWFTPTDEVDLCGHATLASSHVLWEEHGCDKEAPLHFHTLSGVLQATRDSTGWIELDVRSNAFSGVLAGTAIVPCFSSDMLVLSSFFPTSLIDPLSTRHRHAVPYVCSRSGAAHILRLGRCAQRVSEPHAGRHSVHRA